MRTSSPLAPSALIARIACSVLSVSPRKSPTSSAMEREGAGASGGRLASEAPCSLSSVAMASAKRSTTPCDASGRVSPRSPARSPPRTQRSAKASAITAARSTFVVRARLDPKRIDADRSNQIQTVWAASHSRSRTKARSSRAERRQSTRDDGSPDMNGLNCQNVSPEPARRRPCTPWRTVWAILRAAMTRLGRRAESVAASWRMEGEIVIAADSASGGSGRCRRSGGSAGLNEAASLNQLRDEARDHRGGRLALGAGCESERHAVLERGLGERRHILERWRKPAVDQRAGARRQHQRLSGAGSRTPADSFGQLRIAFAGPRRADQIEDRFDHPLADRRAADDPLRRQQILGRHDRPRPRLALACRFDENPALGRPVRIADVDLQKKAVQLRFG